MSVVIHLGGEIPSEQLANKIANEADLIIAADSGYDSCVKNGIVPKIVTGDLDSIQSIPSSTKIKIIHAWEQNATDFEKALRQVPKITKRLDILGGTGLRSDHFLTNLLIATEQPSDREIVFHDDMQTIYRVTPDCTFNKHIPLDTIISLIPFSDCTGTSTKGLKWNLDNASMGPHKQFGQSNEVADEKTQISIKQGRLYVVVNRIPV